MRTDFVIPAEGSPEQRRRVEGPDLCRVDSVNFNYGAHTALQDITLSAARGEMVALVGPSGAGKTTLLRIITGMLEPRSGEVSLFGVRLSGVKDSARRTRLVGMMQQRLDLVPQLSARHNADTGMLGRWGLLRSLAALFLPLSHQPTTAALARVGLAGRESQRVARLSGGEQQRVAMARVLVQDPEVIVADEPVASLDPALADELLSLLRSIAIERSRTVIASVHAPEMARRHFDRMVGLRDGSVVFDLPSPNVTTQLLDDLYRRQQAAPVNEPEHEEHGEPTWGR